MDKTEKRRWTKADILLISVGLLLLLALIGQEIVAFQIERKNKAERFMVGFCLWSRLRRRNCRKAVPMPKRGDLPCYAAPYRWAKCTAGWS